jgi:hypothetical protein
MAALIAPTAAIDAFGASAALPDTNTTLPRAQRQTARAVKLQRHAGVPLRVRHREHVEARHRAGHVHQRIDAPVGLQRCADHGVRSVGSAQVRGHDERLLSHRTDLRCHFLQRVLALRAQHHASVVLREAQGGCPADAGTGAGHDHD